MTDVNMRYAIVLRMARELISRGSWCGETHLQKSIYLLEKFLGKDFDYDFILYKHGPFSFELRSELAAMRGANLFAFAIRDQRYGPTVVPTDFGGKIEQSQDLREVEPFIRFVADWIAKCHVAELERLATALLVIFEMPHGSLEARAQQLHDYKPHISLTEAESAIAIAETKLKEAASLQHHGHSH
ncbi:MAG TPA: hypothetical protein VHA70_01655 [Bauldia sp.]|nr:hypothetical protein [Bauldia sp.]